MLWTRCALEMDMLRKEGELCTPHPVLRPTSDSIMVTPTADRQTSERLRSTSKHFRVLWVPSLSPNSPASVDTSPSRSVLFFQSNLLELGGA